MKKKELDSCSEFQEKMNRETMFRGNLSVRKQKNEQPLLMFGNNKAMLKNFYLPERLGVGQMEKQYWCQKVKAKGLRSQHFSLESAALAYKLM